jgi:hypothetical protein
MCWRFAFRKVIEVFDGQAWITDVLKGWQIR